MALLIGIVIAVFVVGSLARNKGSAESTKKGKSFFFEGGDDFTDEDYILMEMMEEEEDE